MPKQQDDIPFDVQLKKNKLVALLTIFVTICMPIAGFFSIPMPATKHDIAALHEADISIRKEVKMKTGELQLRNIKVEIDLLNMDEERYTERKYENLRYQDEFKLANKSVPSAYTQEQSDIESKLKHVQTELDMKKEELRMINQSMMNED